MGKSLYEEGGEWVADEHAFAYYNDFFLEEGNLVGIEDVEDGFGGAGNEVGRAGKGLFHRGEVGDLLETVDVLSGGNCVDEVVFGRVLGEGQFDGDRVEVLFFVELVDEFYDFGRVRFGAEVVEFPDYAYFFADF